MRQIWKFPLSFAAQMDAPPICSVDMPKGSQIVRVAPQGGTPTLWAIVDPHQPAEPRRFAVFGTGHPLAAHGAYVGTWDSGSFVWHLFEMVGEPLPEGVNLPDDVLPQYQALTAAGFRSVERAGSRAWLAPDDEPLTTEQIMAVATLQEHGFGPVVSA